MYSAAISLDGFIADDTGGVDWLHAAMVPGEGYGLSEFMASIDAVLMGSRTYEKSLELGVMPVVLGSGIPVFAGGIPATQLDLVEQTRYQGGALGVRYRFRR